MSEPNGAAFNRLAAVPNWGLTANAVFKLNEAAGTSQVVLANRACSSTRALTRNRALAPDLAPAQVGFSEWAAVLNWTAGPSRAAFANLAFVPN